MTAHRTAQTPRPLLDEKAVAAWLGVSRRTVQSWRQKGVGPTYNKLATGTVRYRLEDILDYMRQAA